MEELTISIGTFMFIACVLADAKHTNRSPSTSNQIYYPHRHDWEVAKQ